ncbi:MAG: endonuclease MutS2, partial [Anaerolineales bacterium]
LQEPIITQREGRYVLPIRADFKGRIKAIVHDQSSSGATVFIEPLPIIELNNQNRQLQLDERDEEHRILSSLTSQLANHLTQLENGIAALAKFDFVLACGKYALAINAIQPTLLPLINENSHHPHHPGSTIRLIQARHPLLDANKVVPIDVEIDDQTFALVITGPNTGGKTVSLKTIGLLTLMAQSGLHIPAAPGSAISVFDQIFADIGDEQSIEQSLSTFSGHVKNIVRILEKADPRSLVILDELGAGTDPQEGAALARAILTYLVDRKITTLVTTHHPELKIFAHVTPGVTNASVEFDLETLQPTYRLTIGLPGRSNAIAIAERLGMPAEIIELARQDINPQELQSQDLLDEIYRQRELIRQAYQQAEIYRKEVEALRSELSHRLENIEKERQEILNQAEQEAQNILNEVQEEIRKARKRLSLTQQPIEEIKQAEAEIVQLEEKVEKQLHKQRRQTTDISKMQSHIPKLGDKVQLRSLGTKGTLTQINGDEIEVQAGMLRIRSDLSDIMPVLDEEIEAERSPLLAELPKTQLPRNDDVPNWELDVRGKTVDEVLDILEPYVASAMIAGLPFIRIIHGKGSGRLRQAIRNYLKDNPHILSFEAGDEREGGDGVTIVKLN